MHKLPTQRLTSADKAFPRRLLRLAQPPEQIYARGNVSLLDQTSLAVVGSRNISPYGKQIIEQLVTEAAWAKITIVSGLALGIDGHAHRATLNAKGNTIAVLPCGIERVYPANHFRLAEDILRNGGLIVSEYGGDMLPRKYHFVARNRLIAGLAQAVLIAEAGQRSGSLHTAKFALEEGKDVLAVPGSIFSPTSAGTNQLIAQGAHPVTSAQDILNFFNKESQAVEPKGDNAEEQLILDLISGGTIYTDDIIIKGKFEAPVFSHHMTMLEISGKVQRARGGRWSTR